MSTSPETAPQNWRESLHEIIYEANTPAGKLFDIALLIFIGASIAIVMLDSVPEYHRHYGDFFLTLEWVFTVIFTIEYLLRLLVIRRPLHFIFSPIGLIDLLSIIPAYLSIFIPGAQSLLALRILRLLRVFRIFKLTRYIDEAQYMTAALRRSLRKISIFMLTVVNITIVLGTVMYLAEGEDAGFTSIPTSIYWAIVTITTVGYGDIAPVTAAGKFIASLIMLIGYGIIAVPTGIITSELAEGLRRRRNHSHEVCPACGREDHDADARFCKYCGHKI